MSQNIHLDPAQQRAVDTVLARRTGIVGITGPAGAGKTTLVKALVSALGPRLILAAPTNKAAARLADVTGAVARTIHKLAFQPVHIDEDTRGVFDKIRTDKGKMVFRAKSGVGLALDQVLVVDEASMINRRMYETLVSFAQDGLLVLIGDDNQLPPVGDTFSVFAPKPDGPGLEILELHQVHRQGKDSPILAAANQLLTNAVAGSLRPLDALGALPRVDFYRLIDIILKGYAEYGPEGFTAITYRNQARDEITRELRKVLGYQRGTLVSGEPLVITRNRPEFDLYNGDVVIFKGWLGEGREYTLSDGRHHVRLASMTTVRGDRTVSAVLLLTAAHLNDKDRKKLDKDFDGAEVLIAEYGYVLTAHKSQGSQWQNVVVCYDECGQNNVANKYRWAYTAITRAVESCLICELPRHSVLSFDPPAPRPQYTPEQIKGMTVLQRVLAGVAL